MKKFYYESRLKYVKETFKNGKVSEVEALVNNSHKIKQLMDEYKKIPGHNLILVGAVQMIHYALQQMH
jgi:hypothetical protein